MRWLTALTAVAVMLIYVGAAFGQVAVALQAVAAPTATNPAAAKRQLAIGVAGVWFRLGPFVLGQGWITMTLIIENRGDGPVHVAALYRPGSSRLETAISDTAGGRCLADSSPAGITALPDPAQPEAVTGEMTGLPPRSRMNIVLHFADCRLSSTSTLSLSGRFLLMIDRHRAHPITVPFWGIVQETINRS